MGEIQGGGRKMRSKRKCKNLGFFERNLVHYRSLKNE